MRSVPRASSSRLGRLAAVPEHPSSSEPSTSAPASGTGTAGFDGGEMEQQLLHLISAGDEGAALQLLVTGGTSAKARAPGTGASALLMAAERGMMRLAEQLLGMGAEVDLPAWDGTSPLAAAVRARQLHAAELLLQRGADVNKPDLLGLTPLMTAATNADVPCCRLLLAHLAAVDMRNASGETALMRASVQLSADTAQALISAGANVSVADVELTFTALMFSASQGCTDCARALLQAGANPSACNKDSITALHLASRAGHEGVVTVLLEAGADADALDVQDHTPLMLAAMGGHRGVVRVLLQHNASPTVVSKAGFTAMSIAAELNHRGIVQDLLQKRTTKVTLRAPIQSSSVPAPPGHHATPTAGTTSPVGSLHGQLRSPAAGSPLSKQQPVAVQESAQDGVGVGLDHAPVVRYAVIGAMNQVHPEGVLPGTAGPVAQHCGCAVM